MWQLIGMGSTHINHEKYSRLLQAFREAPANVSRCAAACGCSRPTARKAWLEGWPERELRPIKDVYREEQLAARARLNQQREDELARLAKQQAEVGEAAIQERARDDSIESIVEETKMVRASRHSAMALQVVVQRLLRGGAQLAEKIEEKLGSEDLSPHKAIILFREIASMTRQANESARLSQQMEHSLVGKPDQWIGVAGELSPQDVEREMRLANKALNRLKRKGIVVEAIDVPAE